MGWLVEVLTRYSNPRLVNDLRLTEQVVMASLRECEGADATKLHRASKPRPAQPKPKKKRKELSETEARAMVREYRAGGITQKQLAVKHDIALATVERIVKRYREDKR
jgi:hypothetical protein